MGIFKKILDTDIPAIIEKTGFAIDSIITSKEEEMQIALEREKAELEFEKDIFKSEVEDRSSARNMQIEAMQIEALKSEDKFIKRFSAYLTIFSLIFSFAYILLITFVDIPQSSQRYADTILGLIIGLIIGSIYNYWFGSSYGSLRKTNLLKGEDSEKNPK